ncbi:MAG: hypothetical protein RQ862_04765 [Candidatus Caldarchaeales archaeon]|nr:hypothetical protein [Candidatus Caldarchaeales archaeon]
MSQVATSARRLWGRAVKIYADVHRDKKSGDGFSKQHRNTSTYREDGEGNPLKILEDV